jgi:uncharacterized membrane protein YphA (DoxX/SURF4 family)
VPLEVIAIVLALPLFAGYLTPIAAALGVLVHGIIWLRFHGVGSTEVVLSIDLIALALLGPGGYSLDALQFGRRVIVLRSS